MSRVIVTIVLAIIVLSVAFGAFGFLSISDGFLGALQEIPFFGLFVDLGGKMLGIETGHLMTPIDPLKDFINLLILALAMSAIDKAVDWIMEAFVGNRPIDNIIAKFNRVAWKFVITMITLFIASTITDKIFTASFESLGTIITYLLGLLVGGGLVALIIFVGITILGQTIVAILIGNVIKPLIQAVIMLWLYVMLYLVMTSGWNAIAGTAIIMLIGICLMIEAVTHVFTRPNK